MGALLAMTASAYADNVGKSNGDSLCITSSATAEMQDCGGLTRGQVKRPSAPVSKLDTIDRKKDDKKSGPTGPSIELDAAARRNREAIKAREFSLLTREVALLRRLSDRTPVKDPRRPDILLRLAETLFEMQAVVNERVRKYDEPIYQCQKKKDQGCVKKLSGEQKKAEAELKTIREDTIRAYATLVKDHPSFKRMDEVLFSLAFGLEELRQFDRARQVYHRLIKGFPQSKFVPHAYLSFAEYYFAEGDMKAALQFYGKVLEFPPARNPVYGYSLYKSAWAAYNMEDFKGSLKMFTDVIEFATQNPDARDSENLAKQSRKEMVLPYAMVGTPNKALEFFSRFTKTKQQALETFEALGELYFDTGKWENVIAVYQRLIAEAPRSERVCYWQTRVANAIISSKPKVDQVREAQRVVDLYDTFSKDNRPQEAVNECKQAAVTMLVSLATSWHREAIGAEGQPGTNDRNTMKYASTLYRLALDKFKDLDKLEFPDIDRRDWPTEYKLQYFYAELLWKMEEWGQCGPAFDHVVELNPKGEYTSDAAYAAVLCYNNLYQQQYQPRQTEASGGEEEAGKKGGAGAGASAADAARFAPRAFTPLEEGMLRAFSRYVCYVDKSDADMAQIKYRRARIYYEANHFEEAAVLFRDVAFNYPNSDLAEYAANLYLDCLNILGTERSPAKVACVQQIENELDPLRQQFCSTPEAADAHEDLCGSLAKLQCQVRRKQAEAYQSNKEFKRAAAMYVRIFRRNQQCGAMDEVLYDAAINFEAARLLGRAIQVRKVLIARYPDSPLAKRALFLVGANYHAL
ncbi:MAG: tetratricopeptide repeat protein, partial [Myxococcales bacterium]|nr:tetratricopeptide repeat protein [Myxococcales bacterium]